MENLITTPQIIHWTDLLWLLLAAVWLGSLPFVKPTIHRQSLESGWQQHALFFIGAWLLFGSLSTPEWLGQPILAITAPLALIGFGIVLCGVGFSIWARLILGENWSADPSIKQDHALIQRGPYRIVRHPIYTGILVALAGSALQHGLLRSFLGVVLCAISLWMKVTVEERYMVHRFGDQYLRYRKNVSALVPFLF
jgi:protein-S-isoprenylcysteine O-methyltransferase Ste14